MNNRILLDRLLYYGILEIRSAVANDEKDKALDLLNLFHSVPNSMALSKAEADYELILRELKDRAVGRQLGEWIEKLLEHILTHSE